MKDDEYDLWPSEPRPRREPSRIWLGALLCLASAIVVLLIAYVFGKIIWG